MIEITYNGFEDAYLRDQGFGYRVNAGNRDDFLKLLQMQLAQE